MKQTENFKLNLIDRDDTFSPDPLNENMEKLDAALGSGGTTARVYYGSYTGDGTFGKANPTSVTVPFEPKIMFMNVGSVYYNGISIIWYRGASGFYYPNNLNIRFYITWEGSTVSWYQSYNSSSENGPTYQLNTKDKVYYYIAIG